MKKLNSDSTQIFHDLIAAMNGKGHLKIKNEPYDPITIESIGQHHHRLWGAGKLYSLCQYYVQYGDLMQDPEMCFIVSEQQDAIYPYMYQQANLGIYQESVRFAQDGKAQFHRQMQADHATFADQWLHNIKIQGFLNKAGHGAVSFSD